MTAVSGLLADVAWTGYTGLYASPGYVRPYRFTLDVPGATFPTTGFSPTVVVATNGALPYSWGGTITCRAPNTPASGFSGNVSWSGGSYTGYATNVREWNLDISWAEKQVTAMDGSGVNAHSWIPLLASWRGGFSGYVDTANKLELPNLPGVALATLTLKLLENSAGTDDTIAGTAIATQVTSDVGVETGGDFTYSFEGSGQLTVAGTNYGVASSGIFSGGALITPTANTLTLTAGTSLTYSGSAFPTGISWRVGVASGIECVIRYRGTGALTTAEPA